MDFADRLNLAFHTITKPDGSEYTSRELEAATGVTPSYIGRLRSGKADNPSLKVILAFAQFFNVNPSYFVDDIDVNETLENALKAQQLVQNEFEEDLMKKILPIIRDLRREHQNK